VTGLEEALIRFETDARVLRLRWALVGGLAVSARAEPRTTNDLDFALVVANDREAETVVRAFHGMGYRDQPEGAELEQLEVGRLAGFRFVAPGVEPLEVGVDLLFASSGIEPEIVAAAQVLEALPGVFLPVATLSHLLALKVLAGRTKDQMDARSLLRFARQGDVERAREALRLIDRRGFHRGKDLLGDFQALLKART
jgi:Nucleotidyl transferase AbiEii toxin, Type IV TA system